MFKGWDILMADDPQLSDDVPLYLTSPWVSTANVIMLDEKRVCIDPTQTNQIASFEK